MRAKSRLCVIDWEGKNQGEYLIVNNPILDGERVKIMERLVAVILRITLSVFKLLYQCCCQQAYIQAGGVLDKTNSVVL